MKSMRTHAHLVVQDFVVSEFTARAIKCALETGFVDRLIDHRRSTLGALSAALRLPALGLEALAGLLERAGVLERAADEVWLSARFREALAYRDLLELRIAFSDLIWPDIHDLFTPLLFNVPEFMAKSRVFDLFRYDRCFEATPENLAATRAWTRFTTGLTKYESRVVLDAVPMESVETFVDLGGNTGEFALRLCERHERMTAIVVDLPVVCAIGRSHVDQTSQSSVARRIAFRPGDMRRDVLPAAADLVSFKSVLHDWPEQDAVAMIERAARMVNPGGRLMIFERAPLDLRTRPVTYAMAPDLVFLHFLRPADLYLRTLDACGFRRIEYQAIPLEIDFHLIVAHRSA